MEMAFGVVDGVAETEVHVRVAAAVSRGDDDRLGELAPDLASLGVDGRLFVFDRGPMGMAGHEFSSLCRFLVDLVFDLFGFLLFLGLWRAAAARRQASWALSMRPIFASASPR